MNDTFAREILEGLTSTPKRLPSKYFYDKEGDRLFQEIMKLDEYYLTSCEHEILSASKDHIRRLFTEGGRPFNLVEFGAGDGYKTKILLRHFTEMEVDFEYVPIDISANVLDILENNLMKEIPGLSIRPIADDYFSALHNLRNGGVRNIILFLGSNIGNFPQERAFEFLSQVYGELKRDDLMLIGFDLKKEPETILAAYNDSKGVTREFNLNLLRRINRELGTDIRTEEFLHYPVYNPLTGTAKSYLVSRKAQKFEIRGQKIELDAWEAIHMEVSQKFSRSDITRMASLTGFTDLENFTDKRGYFVDSVWKK